MSLEFSASCGGDLGVSPIVWDVFTLCRCCGTGSVLYRTDMKEERTEDVSLFIAAETIISCLL